MPALLVLMNAIHLALIAPGLMAAASERPSASDPPDPGASVECVNSSQVEIGYTVADGGPPMTGVELWYTLDRGGTWRQAGAFGSTVNPIVFESPSDGLFGFFLVLKSAAAATPAPTPGTEPHRWIRVDRAAPLVQVLEIASDQRFDLNREIRIRWTALDDNLAERPVALHYRSEDQKQFQPIASRLPRQGTFVWTAPEITSGRTTIKVSATDRAGNLGTYLAEELQITDSGLNKRLGGGIDNRPVGQAQTGPARKAGELDGVHAEPDAGWDGVPDRIALEAKRQYDLGTWHRLRGELGVARARYQDALESHPGYLAARTDLAGLLLIGGSLKEAEEAYRRVLGSEPKHVVALRGLALAQAKQRNYRSAHTTLQKLLAAAPEDAEGWLHFGDVCMFMGERHVARQAWAKVNEIKDCPREIALRAEKRLELYQGGDPSLESVTGSNRSASP